PGEGSADPADEPGPAGPVPAGLGVQDRGGRGRPAGGADRPDGPHLLQRAVHARQLDLQGLEAGRPRPHGPAFRHRPLVGRVLLPGRPEDRRRDHGQVRACVRARYAHRHRPGRRAVRNHPVLERAPAPTRPARRRDRQHVDRPGAAPRDSDAGRPHDGRGGQRGHPLEAAAGAAGRALGRLARLQLLEQDDRAGGAVPGGVDLPAGLPERGGEGGDRRGGPHPRARRGGQDRHRPDGRQERLRQGTGPRLVRVVRARRGSPAGGGGLRRAGRSRRRRGGPRRAQDLRGLLPPESRPGDDRRVRLMLRLDRRLLQNVDWLLLGAALFIIALSLVSLWSLNPTRGISSLVWRQASWVGVGLVGLLVVASVDYRNLVRTAPVLYVVGLGLLTSVFVLGRTVSGARRWIHLGPLTVQPSELFKLIFIITLAWALTTGRGVRSRTSLIGTFVLLGIPFLLVVRQPDLGTALCLIPVLGAILVGIGIPLKVLGGMTLAGVAAMPLGWFVLKPYQRDRLLVYLDPFRDPLGTAYNV